MNTGLPRLELTRLVALGGHFQGWSKRMAWCWRPGYLNAGGAAVLAILIAGFVLGVTNWPRSFGFRNQTVNGQPGRLMTAAPEPVPAAITAPAADDASPQPETAPPETAAVDGLRILSQHWRRGGLGSNALVTFTLRNGNNYAVKDIEISCAFSRRDGSHLTDRTRIIHDTVRMRGRKRFARLHVGFVNVNADRAKCTLVAASRI
ncbi:hypothetical protein [Bradyrhizobium sp.]|uniref:hypothetical protein n=1 Tax=Bradyrhizobium sp. TaxID=376 RepID=UPI00263A3198|nr:hypothetical protein [Bradyrhizobium sp.]